RVGTPLALETVPMRAHDFAPTASSLPQSLREERLLSIDRLRSRIERLLMVATADWIRTDINLAATDLNTAEEWLCESANRYPVALDVIDFAVKLANFRLAEIDERLSRGKTWSDS